MKAWDEFLKHLEQIIGEKSTKKWLQTLKIIDFDAGNLFLLAQDAFQINWFEEHIRKVAEQKFLNNNARPIKIHLSLPNESLSKKIRAKKSKNNSENNLTLTLQFDPIYSHCTFPNTVVSQSNLITHKLLEKITGYDPVSNKNIESCDDLTSFNPIYIHGPRGSGKTHLLMACANALQQMGKNALYVHTKTFTEHVIAAIRVSEMHAFRNAYRSKDVLIIDDIHMLAKKSATQEELFHTFNTLHLDGKQIILSSNCHPSQLTQIESRLVSRFEWGIVLPLTSMGREEKRQALLNRSKQLNFSISPPIQDFLLDQFSSNLHTLMVTFEALVLRCDLKKTNMKTLSLNLVKNLLDDLLLKEQSIALTPQSIIHATISHFGIAQKDILGKSKNRNFVLPRQIAMYLCRKHIKMPFVKIGELFNRDHSTVMSSVKAIDHIQLSNREIGYAISSIQYHLELK